MTTPGLLCLDTITLKGTPVLEQLRVARDAGYRGVRIRGNDVKAFLADADEASPAELGRLVREAGLVTPGFVTEPEVYEWHFRSPDEPTLAAALEATFETARAVGAACAVLPVMQPQGDLQTTARNFRAVCDRARSHGLSIALECIGHIPKVPDVATAWRIVEEADRPNGGLLVDLFHFYRGGSSLESLRQVPPDRVLMVDLDDAMDLPVPELLGYKHRLYPGEGVAPVAEVLALLAEGGYAGPYAVELFNEDYWAADPREVARRSFEASRAVLARAFGG